MQPGTVFIASDHAGYSLKEAITTHLEKLGWSVENLGTDSPQSVDYPNFAHHLSEKVLQSGHFGILICGTGIGMSIAANRHSGIRAAVCTHEFHATACRRHNNANVLCLGERVTAPGLACILAELFLATEYEGGRHQQRIEKIEHKQPAQ